jgi:mutator protein MutT
VKNLFKLPAYVGIMLQKNNEVLLVKRCNSDWMNDYWSFPGGLLEENESLPEAATRETEEEIGVVVQPDDFELLHVLQVHKHPKNNKDILGFYFKAELWQGDLVNKEPHKHSAFGWFAINDLPSMVTEHVLLVLDGIKTGKRFSEENS